MAINAKLKEAGWYLTANGIEECRPDSDNVNVTKIIEIAKNTDLKDIGDKWLPDDVNKGKCEYVQGPGVLQIQKIRNVTAPKDNEESNYAPRMLKLVLTDGQLTCNALEMEKLERIGLDTCPGSKIYLKGKVEVEHGFLKLYNRNVNFVGGRVDKIADNWELRKKLSRQVRLFIGSEGGPPAFTPFGQKTKDKKPPAIKKETQNFKSLETQTKEKKAEDDEFEQQRKAIIAEALQAKEEGKSLNFGGQKQVGQDKDIARIVEMGFSASQASSALQQSNGDVNQAINALLSNDLKPGGDLRREQGGNVRGRDIPTRDDRRERGGRGQRGRDNGEEEDAAKQRPSGPATLFDFLETKIKPEKDSKEKSRNNPPLQSYDNASNKYGDSRTYDNRREPPNKYQDRPPRNERGDNRYNDRRSDFRQNDQSEKNYNRQTNDSDRTNRNNDRGRYSNENKREQGSYAEKSDRYEADRRKDRGQQRAQGDRRGNSERGGYNQRGYNDKGYNQRGYNERGYNEKGYNERGYNERGGRENKTPRGDNSDQSNSAGNRPKTGNQDRRGGNQQDYQQNRPRSEISGHDASQKSSYGNRNSSQKQPPAQENFDSGNQFNSNQFFQSAQSVPQFNPDVPPPPLLQQYNNFVPNQGAYNGTWKKGDRCMAKYWEDNKFYSAVVENIDPRYPTVVVHFLEYGNSEEVSLSDVRPDPQFMGSMGNQGSSSLPQQKYPPRSGEDSKFRSMEFRRQRPDQDNKQQKLYQPPNHQPLY